MARKASLTIDGSARLSFWLLSTLLIILWFTGGASQATALGQAVTRFAAWVLVIGFTIGSPRFEWRSVSAVAIILATTISAVALQLVPLPPALWTQLPGRDLLIETANVIGQPQPWRPISISPTGTFNALSSLIVPFAVVAFGANLTQEHHWAILLILLASIVAGCLVALLQFSGANYDNVLINYVQRSVSGNFANRNHFGAFVALGCLLAPIVGFRQDNYNVWKAISSVAVLPFFFLIILATGSRTATLLGALAISFALAIVWPVMVREIRALPRGAKIGICVSAFIGIAAIGLMALSLDRGTSVERALDLNAGADLRLVALPYVIEAIRQFFPVGAGFGTFDPAYRIIEPEHLLQPKYFNHAHNDWIEIVQDGGGLAIMLLAGALLWWVRASTRAWQRAAFKGRSLARAASVGIALILIASIFDYPLRTPMMMAVLALLAVWLSIFTRSGRGAIHRG